MWASCDEAGCDWVVADDGFVLGVFALVECASIYQDWQTFKATYPLLENKRLFEAYPELACKVMEDLFSPTTQPGSKALAALREEMKGKVSMMDLAKDMYQISRGIVL